MQQVSIRISRTDSASYATGSVRRQRMETFTRRMLPANMPMVTCMGRSYRCPSCLGDECSKSSVDAVQVLKYGVLVWTVAV